MIFINCIIMKVDHPVGTAIGALASLWASVTFLRSGITGAPPLYSKERLQRILHIAAGIIFALLAADIAVMLIRK